MSTNRDKKVFSADPIAPTASAPLGQLAQPATYRCRVLLSPEEVGFSAQCLNLPGVISQGDTEQEALENVADAVRETVSYYRDTNQQVPWNDVDAPRMPGSFERSIAVSL